MEAPEQRAQIKIASSPHATAPADLLHLHWWETNMLQGDNASGWWRERHRDRLIFCRSHRLRSVRLQTTTDTAPNSCAHYESLTSRHCKRESAQHWLIRGASRHQQRQC